MLPSQQDMRDRQLACVKINAYARAKDMVLCKYRDEVHEEAARLLRQRQRELRQEPAAPAGWVEVPEQDDEIQQETQLTADGAAAQAKDPVADGAAAPAKDPAADGAAAQTQLHMEQQHQQQQDQQKTQQMEGAALDQQKTQLQMEQQHQQHHQLQHRGQHVQLDVHLQLGVHVS